MLTPYTTFGDLFRQEDPWAWGRTMTRSGAFQPAVDVVEEEDQYVLKAELPGMKPEQVEINLHGGVLTLKGEQRYENEDHQGQYRRVERRYGRFERSFNVPELVDTEAIEASMEDGVLRVRLPKQPTALPRKIEVKAGKLADKAKRLFGRKSEDEPHVTHS